MRFENSIRRTLLVRCGIGITALFILLSLTIYLVVRRGLYEEIDESITETASILANQIEYEHGAIIFEWQEGLGTNTAITDKVLFQYWNDNTGLTTRSPMLADLDLPRFVGINNTPEVKTVAVPHLMEHARAIGLTIHPYLSPEESAAGVSFDAQEFPHTLVVARDLTPVKRTLAYLAATLCISTFVTLACGFLIIRQAISSSLRPISNLTRQVQQRSESQLDSAISIPGRLPVELVPLAESFDSLLGRVAAIRGREKDFIRHASHELRTPIAALSAITELALSRARDSTEYRKHLETCARTAADLSSLVNRLAALSRIGQIPTQEKEPVDPGHLLGTCLESFEARISERSLGIEINSGETLPAVQSDPVLLRLIFNNLLDNAISYSPEGGIISVTTQADSDGLRISFTNPALDLPDHLDRLFEPLFRQDGSRQENCGSHLGIGLTLSQNAAHAMGAALTATRPGKGLVSFTLSLPT